VRAALHDAGIPDIVIEAESRGAADLVVQTTKAEARNRRVEVRFEVSKLLRGALSQGLTLGQSGETSTDTGGSGGVTDDARKICEKYPKLCYPGPRVAPNVQPIPDNTPYKRMDLLGVGRPGERGDLSHTWAQLYWKYRRLGFSEERAAWLANKEISATSDKEQSRNNPNAADRLDTDMQKAYPDATKVGPGSIELFRF
jgi:hypothetical protein